jgi:triacylglycerol lipase
VVFCHGLLGFDSVSIGLSIAPIQVTHWRGIREVLETVGATVLMTRVPATSAPAERARVLANAIAEHLPGKKIHLIGPF